MTGEWRRGDFWNVISIGPGDEKIEWKDGIPTLMKLSFPSIPIIVW